MGHGGRNPRLPGERAWSRVACPSPEPLCPADPCPTPGDPPQRASPDLLLQPDLCLALNFGLCWSRLLVQPEDTWCQGGFPAGTSQGSWCLTSGSPGGHEKDSLARLQAPRGPAQTGPGRLTGITAVEDGDGVRGREWVSSGSEAWEWGPAHAGRGRLYAPGSRSEGSGLCRRGLTSSSSCTSGLLAGLPFIDSTVALREAMCTAPGGPPLGPKLCCHPESLSNFILELVFCK